jgi:hypothetical protein
MVHVVVRRDEQNIAARRGGEATDVRLGRVAVAVRQKRMAFRTDFDPVIIFVVM